MGRLDFAEQWGRHFLAPALFCALFTCGAGAAVAMEVTEFFPDGSKRLVYNVNADNKRDGAFVEYFPDGKKKIDAQFKDGELNGVCKEFFANGQLSKQITYRAGKRHGPAIFWPEDRATHEVENYRDDKLHGNQKKYQGDEIVSDEYFIDGKLIYPRSAALLAKNFAKIRTQPIKLVGDEPNIPELYRAGYDDPAIHAKRVAQLRELKAYRMLCGIPWQSLELDRGRVAYAQAAAELIRRHGELTHEPPNPGLSESDYEFGLFGTTHTNISGGKLDGAVHSFMNDSDKSNVADCGHRRWCLNPGMQGAGFGEAGTFSAMYSVCNNEDTVADVVAFPTRGLMPVQFFGARHAWSVSLSPHHFAQPDPQQVKAAIYPAVIDLKEGRIDTAAQPLPLDVMTIGSDGLWDYCVIFRPAPFKLVPRTSFVVRITGLTDLQGAEKNLEYVVSFYRG